MEAVGHMMGTRVGTRVSCYSVHGQKQAALTSEPISVGPVHSALSAPPFPHPANPFRPLPTPPPPTTMVAHPWVEYEIGLTWWVWCGELLGHGEPGARPGAGMGPSICAHVPGTLTYSKVVVAGGAGLAYMLMGRALSVWHKCVDLTMEVVGVTGVHRGACTGG